MELIDYNLLKILFNFMEVLEINKFANLHDGEKIFFSHIDMCEKVFDEISKLDHNVILITGNHDTPVGRYTKDREEEFKHINKIFDSVPKNVKYWFAQNNITKKENIIPIPIGLMNSVDHFRREHGFGYDWTAERHNLLKEVYLNDNSAPSKFLYSNYSNRPNHRTVVKDICKDYLGSEYEEPCLRYENYISNVLDHECVMCPIGVGVDTYRLYEVLYCKRIPITVKVGKYGIKYCDSDYDELSWCDTINCPPQDDEYPVYTDLYSKLPVVMLETLDELKDKEHLKKLIEEQKNKSWNKDLLDFNYWKQMILDYKEKL